MFSFKSQRQCIKCESKLALHSFPKKHINEWCLLLGIPLENYNTNMRICIEHFDSSFISDKCSNKLKFGAKPIPVNSVLTEAHTYEKQGSKRCCVPCCHSTNLDTVSLFRFPKDSNRREDWIERCRISENTASKKELHICGKHFEPRFFKSPKLLSNTAEPTMFLDDYNHVAESIETEQEVSVIAVKKLVTQGTISSFQKCSVPFCVPSSRKVTYSFPEDSFYSKIWSNLCGLNNDDIVDIETKSLFICQEHFKPDCFNVNGLLNSNALPTIFPIPSMLVLEECPIVDKGNVALFHITNSS